MCENLWIYVFFKRTFLTQILLLGVPGTKYFEIGVHGQIHIILGVLDIGFLHTFSRFFKNSRSTSSQRGTRCRAVSLYICYFSIVNIHGGPAVNPCTQGPEFGVTPLTGTKTLHVEMKKTFHLKNKMKIYNLNPGLQLLLYWLYLYCSPFCRIK